MVGNEEDARDMAQEAFIRAFNSLGSFRGESKFSVWLYRLTSNICIDFLRGRAKRRTVSLSWEDEDGDEGELEIPDERFSPEAGLERSELREAVRRGLEQLTPEYREILLLREINGLSYDEIGRALNLEEGDGEVPYLPGAQKTLRDFSSGREHSGTGRVKRAEGRCERMSDCGEYEKLISLYMDGELPEPEKTGLEAHMAECSRCRRLCDAFRAISLSLGEEAAPAGFSSGVMAAVKTQGESGASRAKKPGKSWPKYLALAACIALAALTTVRLALPSGSRTADAGAGVPQPRSWRRRGAGRSRPPRRGGDESSFPPTTARRRTRARTRRMTGVAGRRRRAGALLRVWRGRFILERRHRSIDSARRTRPRITDEDDIWSTPPAQPRGRPQPRRQVSGEASIQRRPQYEEGSESMSVWS